MEHEPDVLTARRGTARRGQATPTQIAALIATATTSITARSAEPALTVALATILSEVREVRRFGSATQVRAHFGRCSRDTQSGT